MRNWGGNLTFGARRVHEPRSVTELQELVAASPQIRALGTRHSFSGLADTPADLVSVAALPARVEVSPCDRADIGHGGDSGYSGEGGDTAGSAARATVSAGLRYGDVASRLHEQGWALPNMASLPHISVAGSIATATHGSGDRNRSLAGAVAGLEVVLADGSLHAVGRDDPDFAGWVVSLGALGVVTAVTLDVVPTYDVAQWVYDELPFDTAVERLDEVLSSAYSVSAFTDWRRPARFQVWR